MKLAVILIKTITLQNLENKTRKCNPTICDTSAKLKNLINDENVTEDFLLEQSTCQFMEFKKRMKMHC